MCILSQKIGDFVKNTKTPRLQGSARVSDALEIMDNYQTTIIGVECETDFVGVFTKNDFRKHVIRRNLNPKEVTLYEVMVCNPPTIKADITVKEAYDTMIAYQWDFMPVVQEQSLQAIISLRDLSTHIMQSYEKSDAEYRMLMNYFRSGESYALASYDE